MAIVLAVLAVATFGSAAGTHANPVRHADAVRHTGTPRSAGTASHVNTVGHNGPAGHPDGRRHADTIKYASARGCSRPGQWPPSPCGKWRLVMHGGERRELADARIAPLDGKGKRLKQSVAPIEVSGDGRHVAYFRKSDNRLVVREVGGGKAHAMAADLLPAGFGMDDVTLMLSQDGTRLAVVYYEERKEPTRVYDTTSGNLLWTAPWDVELLGFSGDGGELMAQRRNDDHFIADLYVFGPRGELLHRKPLGEDYDVGPYALAADGTTAAVVTHQHGHVTIVVYDLTSGRITTRVPVRVKGVLHTVAWTGLAQVTIHAHHKKDTAPTQVRVLQVDTVTKKVTTRESYTILSDSISFESCGG
ncbi:hypothetical protein [Nonomuraea sp. LPB2021202275-12-8]|uniref:hypothetical protein n=1 Tax=Nonomuraea sp. LPB2021202275-12-8 TaxID=3120159 RepID=UPI00300C0591